MEWKEHRFWGGGGGKTALCSNLSSGTNSRT